MNTNPNENAWRSIIVIYEGKTNTYELNDKEKLLKSFDRNKKRARLLKRYKEAIKSQDENDLNVNVPSEKDVALPDHSIHLFNYIDHNRLSLSIQISQVNEIYNSQNSNEELFTEYGNFNESINSLDDYCFFDI